MIEKILSLALETGLIAALFTGLLIYVLKDAAKREKKYQDTIDELHESLKVVYQIHKDVNDIKKRIKKDVDNNKELC